MNQQCSQAQTFADSGAVVVLDSVLEGYSASIFAYGQTGSGKTYTMAGVEERLGRNDYISDESDGLVPRAISYLWTQMAQRQEQFYVKAAFMEIYNEQVRDLLNPGSKVLHCRWNIKSGFFVEDLLVVDCTQIDDLIAVLNEGIKNRITGSHELNSESSRSHSILLVYVISEVKTEDGHSFKKFGKAAFVDLAGSERLKESKSQGDMVKETGNINKSLFTLGKVISALGGKNSNKAHIPYRDSKLTMLLMDSLGGTSKAIMIACVTPASLYADETMSTLNYAARTMNIKNRPVIQMDSREQIIFNLKREIQLLRLENNYLKEQMERVAGGLPPEMMQFARQMDSRSSNGKLPPIPNQQNQENTLIVQEYSNEISRLSQENQQLKNGFNVMDRLKSAFVIENQQLAKKLQHLEHVFNDFAGDPANDQQSISNVNFKQLLNENQSLKKQIAQLEQDRAQVQSRFGGGEEAFQLQQTNNTLQKRVEFLQKREKELLEHLMKAERSRK